MRGGRRRSTLNGFSSQREKMAWVRSFIRKKRGSGYRKKHSRRKRYGKGVLYRKYTLSNPFRFAKNRRRRRGGSMVDSGWYGIGDPNNPSYRFNPYR